MRSILITGGAGYIGLHTSLVLLEEGYQLFIIDSFANSSYGSIERLLKLSSNYKLFSSKQIEFFEGDIRNLDTLRAVFVRAIKFNKPIEAVVHFAGLKSVAESISNPDLYWDVNVNGTNTLLKVMQEFNCINLVFSSSATVYSPKEKSPLTENSKLLPINPYGETKLAVENILKDSLKLRENYFNTLSLRYFNPVGAHPSGEIGESPLKVPNNLFPYICDVANSKRDVLNIFGDDWPTKDGTCIRDFIHIMDLANGHFLALNFLLKNNNRGFFKAINLGNGKGTSVLEFVKTFEKVNNLKINYQFSKRRLGDNAIVYSNCDLAKDILLWQPKKDIVQMCRDGWNWVRNNPDGY